MDLNGLIWTKNVKPLNGQPWAYQNISTIDPGLKIFALHWRNLKGRDKINANTPQEGELMILRQRSKVTHIVQMLNKQLYPDKNPGDEFNIYRLVQVVWMTDNWDNPPENDKLFDCLIHFPAFGKAIKLEKIRAFREHWSTKELTFQQHVQNLLNIC
ncbi:hypothetical protein NIES4072_30360 [Nostoc commune NIES-4072]|uniref:Uncharacterized protein n=1 Tax=Nostoc commune NIES-4072 TaxID=2005467 RepID=A0A2R5FMV9_NOSCO|nr:hypothetical protein [Nostoc commune]BBD69629.1 hypothetical protein NIES4070_60390 [Nostoc commune HK-02]GBG19369.1 hypothetical protein NIES4072_30360 [Nostoc commune NIES-4072]